MYIVTGGCGFIGSNLVKRLNEIGINDIIVVDDIQGNEKFLNIVDCDIYDLFDKSYFLSLIESGSLDLQIDTIFHQGACSDTMETDGVYMMKNNYSYSKSVLTYAMRQSIPLIYASSGAVYGNNKSSDDNESPLNIYGFSKVMFDRYVRRNWSNFETTVVGLRYFNVYGPNEEHKGAMASMIHKGYKALKHTGEIKLFEGTNGFANGDQRRDFVYVDDVTSINLFFADNVTTKGIYDVGTGTSRSFNDMADSLIKIMNYGNIKYVPFPEELRNKYQSHTEANIEGLKNVGYNSEFIQLEQGIETYCKNLANNNI
tara:strand:- start:280 stop:1221 length:942 start_codon:yes stop_codon:yes gene_type:complete